MLTIQHTPHFRIESPTIVTIGTFDGVHLGHQKILKRLAELKKETGLKTAVFTFDPHPRKVLFPGQTDLKLISSTETKLKLLREQGVGITVVYPFTFEFSQMDSELYVSEILVKQLKVKHLVIGYDHKFGKNRSGDINTLKLYAPLYGFEVEEISARDIDSISVSSSRIRRALEEGSMEEAQNLLGYEFQFNAKVVKGKQLGRELGYPTANLEPENSEQMLPATGVYFVKTKIDTGEYYGMMSVGYNPTTDKDGIKKCEVHLFDFSENIYGQLINVSFLKRLRDEKKFGGLPELKAAIDSDKEACLQLISALT